MREMTNEETQELENRIIELSTEADGLYRIRVGARLRPRAMLTLEKAAKVWINLCYASQYERTLLVGVDIREHMVCQPSGTSATKTEESTATSACQWKAVRKPAVRRWRER